MGVAPFPCPNAHNNNTRARRQQHEEPPQHSVAPCKASFSTICPAMQPPPPARFYLRLSDELAALLGARRERRREIYEDELLAALREKGLITYPSPLLGRLVEDLPEVFEKEVLPRLDPTGRALLARVGRGVSTAVVSSGLPLASSSEEVPFKVKDFVGSVERLAFAEANGCPWGELTCASAAKGGYLDILRWARGHDCPWDVLSCAYAALGGHLEVLKWAREHHCPWGKQWTRGLAYDAGHEEVVRWVDAN